MTFAKTLLHLPEPDEKDIQREIKRVLRTAGFWFVDNSQPRAAMVTAGLSDLIVMGRGVVVFVEVKAKRGRLTPAQMSFREHVENNGGTYLIWRSAVEALAWANTVPRRRRET